MGWNEFWGWALSDDDESYWEHLERDYGKDAPVIHAILDTAVDTVVGAVPVVGQVYSVQNAKNPTIKEVKDVIWEDRHEILAVASAAPVIGTGVSAVDAVLHAAESVENNVEFFVEGAVSEDEPIYDENGNIIGYKDKWMTDKMNEKRKYAQSHGVNATVGAALTLTGGNYFKGGKAAVEVARKGGGNVVERLLVKNADNAKAAADEARALAKEVAAREAGNVEAAAANAVEKRAAAKAAEETANKAAANAVEKRAAADAAADAKKAAEAKAVAEGRETISHSIRRNASKTAEKASNAESHAAAVSKNAAEAKAAAEAAEAESKKVAEDAVTRNQAANFIKNEAERREQIGARAIDLLESSNDIRSFLTTSVAIGLATVSEYNKNVERFDLPDSYKAPTIPLVND